MAEKLNGPVVISDAETLRPTITLGSKMGEIVLGDSQGQEMIHLDGGSGQVLLRNPAVGPAIQLDPLHGIIIQVIIRIPYPSE